MLRAMPVSDGLNVLYSDNKIVVVDKPSGLLSVPGKGPDKMDCVVTRVQAMFPECRKHPAVHRLDMDTSGILVLGLTARAQRELSIQFQDRKVSKRYVALLEGAVDGDDGVIDLPLRVDLDNRPHQMVCHEHGRRALTIWKKIQIEENGWTRINFMPITGRSHQLRMHASHHEGLGVPIVGDRLYGTGKFPGRLHLHAEFLKFTHPKTGEVMEFLTEAPF